ncbi:DNA-processing protein DprA [Anaerocolumna xylanovorans]|uniref:DNA processing protein n=1 Tax=Anaerocolumna xylanovorans DSM 12503 TaxID=1121345 RepID=A0A1M7YBB6_9FIRM|nr:DNA-processing protein DprA [Anaerocolumna xylanovorans]SHO49902.1 DNA processing protein [Anaerocolumna xylanovorans DSM 12503]
MTKKEYWYWLCSISELSQKKKEAILSFFSSPEEAFKEKTEAFSRLEILTNKDIERIDNSRKESSVQENYAKLKSKGIYFVTIEDGEYPEKLRNIYESPLGIFYKGKLPAKEGVNIAVIGARNCSDYGREMARSFAKELAKAGVGIISGLAAGIDGAAHDGALMAEGDTFGVLGCGADICYPVENFNLYLKMCMSGGILTEYAPGTQPRAYHFPMRNRIISGMSDGILVVEAREKSGSLITVDYGLEQGKNIYAIPGRPGDILSDGCNNILKMGAKMCTETYDILEDYILTCKKITKGNKKNDKLLEANEKIVYACLSRIPKHLNDIAKEADFPIGELASLLFQLESKNYIKQIRANYYVTDIV